MSASLENPASWSVSQWFNTSVAQRLEQFKGRVVVVGAFQMLCPGCVAQSIPQLKKLQELSHKLPLTVIGLHAVFEHHAAMQPHALEAFIHEYGLCFPVGVDAASDDGSPIPKTMVAWQLRGTPSTLVFAPDGELCLHEFGHVDDLVLGTFVGQLLTKQPLT
ncbi:MAG: TlpA disulfide reductase family protein [Methylotenera sp.]